MPATGESGDPITFRYYHKGGPRPWSLTLSLLLHSAAVVALFLFSDAGTFVQPTVYEQEIEPHKDRIVWYHLSELPKISPDGEEKQAVAEHKSPDVMIHQAPDAAHDDRLALRSPDQKSPDRKTPAPDMIAIKRGADAAATAESPVAISNPPNPTKPAPKPFVTPVAPAPAATAQIKIEEPPPTPVPAKLVIPDTSLAALTAAGKIRVSRRFVPPPPDKRTAPSEAIGGNLLPDAPTLPGAGGASDINALIVNPLHSGGIDAAPPRQSAISAGPVTGVPADGGGRSGIQVGGVTVMPRAGKEGTAEASLKSPKYPLEGIRPATGGQPFVTTRIAPLEHTVSAPLPPSSRNIPKLIEARFRGRIVYTILVPMKGLPGYAGDWTIWFAEREYATGGGSGAPMRAPLPVRKPVLADATFVVSPGQVRLSATMNKVGKMDSIAVIEGSGPAVDAAIEDVERWEFLPALRSLEPVDIDLVIEIPFGINTKPVSTGGVPVLSGVDRSGPAAHN
jgi:Gram-negative bacterial TonB protein C-terminal